MYITIVILNYNHIIHMDKKVRENLNQFNVIFSSFKYGSPYNHDKITSCMVKFSKQHNIQPEL